MNFSQLNPVPSSQASHSFVQGEEKDAEFLSLKLLNKRVRIRLSPQPIDLGPLDGKGVYFAVANSKGWFAVVVSNSDGTSDIYLAPLVNLKSTLTTSTAEEGELPFTPTRKVSILHAHPTHIGFAASDQRLVIGLSEGPIVVYDTAALFTPGDGQVEPIINFSPSNSGALRQILPNPGDLPNLVAVRREPDGAPNSRPVEVLDVMDLQVVGGWNAGFTPETVPTSISWSPKGKQLAIGMQSGEILTFSPQATAEPKIHVPKPPQAHDYQLISVFWLSNPSFYTIYAPQGPPQPEGDQKHFIVTYDSKTNSAVDVEVDMPYYTSPGLRPPGASCVVLRNWEPSKFLIFIGDGPSSDIGLVGCVAGGGQDSWHKLGLEETSTPSLPLSRDDNDTVLLGLDLDLTTTDLADANNGKPIMYAYVSDGTLQAWAITNSQGGAYPGMEGASSAAPQPTAAPPAFAPPPLTNATAAPAFGQTSTPAFGSTGFRAAQKPLAFGQSAFGQSNTTPAAALTGFGAASSGPSAFAQAATQPSPFATAAQPAFGKSGFGQAASPSPFGVANTNTGGFGSFANKPPSAFGATGFGFGVKPAEAPPAPAAPAVSIAPSTEMADADGGGFGGLSLGGESASETKPTENKSIFGSFAQFNQSPTQPAFGSATGSSGPIKPATGFGAFAGGQSASPFSSQPKPPSEPSKPSSAFGTTSFGAGAPKPPAFGQSSFGSPGFGQTSFGSSQATAPATSGFGSIKGGFGAFAQSGTSVFGAAAQQSAAASSPQAPAASTDVTPKSVFGGGGSGVFGSSTSSVFGQPPSTPAAKAEEARMGSANSSPSGSPTLPSKPALGSPASPDASPEPAFAKPASSPFGQAVPPTTPTSSPNAFSGVKTTPNAFKLSSGFGAFGGVKADDSPFSKPKATTPQSEEARPDAFTTPGVKSAFGAGGSGVVATPSPAFGSTTAFGLSSKPGFGTSTFGSTTTPPVTPSKPAPAAASGAFSAFSSSGGGFASFASPSSKPSSFGDLLRSGKDDKPKASVSVFGGQGASTTTSPSAKEQPGRTESTTPRPSQFRDVSTPSPQASKRTARDLDDEDTDDDDDEHVLVQEDEGEEADQEDHEEEEEEEEEDDGHDLESIPEEDEYDEVDGEQFTVSAPGSDESGGEDEDGTAVLQTPSSETSTDPTKIPLPPSLSPTPQPPESSTSRPQSPAQVPLPTSPSPQTSKPALPTPGPSISVTKPPSESTTPPGSPAKPAAQSLPLFAPKPAAAAPTTPAPLGLGKPPLNRPARSSPLATTPVYSEPEDKKPAFPTSQSAPVLSTKARPASPKQPFGQLLNPSNAAAPAGSPSSSGPQQPGNGSPLFAFKPPPLPTVPSTPLFGGAVSPSPAPSSGPTPSPFSIPSLPSMASSSPSPLPNLFAAKSGSLPVSNLFGASPVQPATPIPPAPKLTPLPVSNLFGTPSPAPPPRPPVVPVPSQPPAPPPQQTFESGLQAECQDLYLTLNRELDQLRKLGQEAAGIRARLSKPTTSHHSKEDLGDPSKWSFSELELFGRILKTLEDDVLAAQEGQKDLTQALLELESNLLRAETRKEEIVRFSKAKADPEFAKMLKIRTLNPEHIETQNRLRKHVRAVHDRVELLEDHLKACRKKLNEYRTGKMSFKPPSLDTINRTFRNIDIALEQRTEQIDVLRSRVSKLNLDSPRLHATGPKRDKRLTDDLHHRPMTVTPSVAASTAAALNAERSAQKLKAVLARLDRKPLLNTQASKCSVAPMGPKKPSSNGSQPGSLPSKSGALGLSSISLFGGEPPVGEWHDSMQTPERRHGSNRQSVHQKAVQFKKSPTPVPAPIATFDWGPLPGVAPKSSLSADVRLT